MQKRISELEKENEDLVEKLKIKDSLEFENNAYWITKEDKKEGPFCTCCWDDDKKTIRMQPNNHPAYYSCPKCENKSVKIYPERSCPPVKQFKPTHY